MRILLFDPPYERLMGVQTTPLYPIGLSYLAATLKQAGHEVKYINLDYEEDLKIVNTFSRNANINNFINFMSEVNNEFNNIWLLFRQFVLKYSPNIIGISCITLKMKSVLMMARIIKEIDSEILIILGGHHATVYAEEILKKDNNIDIIALGEFDFGIVEVVNAIAKGNGSLYEKLRNVPGLCIRNHENRIIKTENNKYIENLDEIPFPESAYYIEKSCVKNLPLTSMMASRGCPYKCGYCATTNIWGRKVRRRSPENVIKEIKYKIKTYNVHFINFYDDCFTTDKSWIIELCERITKDKIAINWACISSVNLVDEVIFNKIVQAGCIKINLGVETGSDRISKLIRRTVKKETIRQVFGYAKKYRVSTAAYFMIGFPTETLEEIRETQRFIYELSPNWVYVNVLIPLPGTEIFRICVDEDLIDEKEAWCGELYKDLQTNYTGTMSDNKFNELVDETFALCFKINKRPLNLFRRLPIREYIGNPARIFADSRKLISWKKVR